MSIPPRPEVQNLKPARHGGPNWAEMKSRGLSPEDVLDFSVCTNPFPPPPGVRKTIATATINRYPDSAATELRQALSGKLGVPAKNILVGSGTTELIRLIALTYFGAGDSVLIPQPTYGEYEIACNIAGAKALRQVARAEDNYRLSTDETVSLVHQHRPKGIFLCQPNNPTGQYFDREEIATILSAGSDSLLVLDEAYVAFVDEAWVSLDLAQRGNVIILRSMTKDYGLTGLRLGYLVASREIVGHLRRVCPPWNVNIVAQKAGVAALGQNDYLERCQKKVRLAKDYLTKELQSLGFTVLPSRANFFLMRVGNAAGFRAELLIHGIIVRDCASFGLPEYVRIAPRTMAECRKLINAIRALK